MARSSNQKLKLLYMIEILKEYTDEETYRYNSTIDGVIIKIKEQIDDKKNEVR